MRDAHRRRADGATMQGGRLYRAARPAGPGSTVLLVHCVAATQTQRRYRLEPDGWTLQMYETVAVATATCPASPAR
jgi:hypothetical protein